MDYQILSCVFQNGVFQLAASGRAIRHQFSGDVPVVPLAKPVKTRSSNQHQSQPSVTLDDVFTCQPRAWTWAQGLCTDWGTLSPVVFAWGLGIFASTVLPECKTLPCKKQ